MAQLQVRCHCPGPTLLAPTFIYLFIVCLTFGHFRSPLSWFRPLLPDPLAFGLAPLHSFLPSVTTRQFQLIDTPHPGTWRGPMQFPTLQGPPATFPTFCHFSDPSSLLPFLINRASVPPEARRMSPLFSHLRFQCRLTNSHLSYYL